MTQAEIAYLAGFFDGEGTIGIEKQTRRLRTELGQYRLYISVDNTEEEPLLLFALAFGGKVRYQTPRNIRRKGVFRWRAYTLQAENAIRLMQPHLTVKRSRAIVALKFRSLTSQVHIGRYHTLSDVNRLERLKLFDSMKIMNKKGKSVYGNADSGSPNCHTKGSLTEKGNDNA